MSFTFKSLVLFIKIVTKLLLLRPYEPIVMNENIIHALKHIIIINTNWGFDITN